MALVGVELETLVLRMVNNPLGVLRPLARINSIDTNLQK